MQLSDFDYALPDELIARYPTAERRASRLLEVSAVDWRIDTNVKSTGAEKDLGGGSVAIG